MFALPIPENLRDLVGYRPRPVQLSRELIQTTRATLPYLQQAAAQLATATAGAATLWQPRATPIGR
jgi:hypothetical protein